MYVLVLVMDVGGMLGELEESSRKIEPEDEQSSKMSRVRRRNVVEEMGED
jgi:hypothetical protein